METIIIKLVLAFIKLSASLFTTIFGTTFGFLGALYLHRKSIKRDDTKKQTEINENHKLRFKFFIHLIEDIIRTAKRQVEYYKELIPKLKVDPIENHKVELLATNNFDRMQRIDSEDIFRAYLHHFKNKNDVIEDYEKIYAKIDYIGISLEELNNSHKKHMDYIYKDQLKYGEKINALTENLASTSLGIKNSKGEEFFEKDPFAQLIEKMLGVSHDLSSGYAELNQYETKFAKPLRVELVNKFRNYPNSDFLSKQAHESGVILNGIDYNSKEHAKDIEQILTDLNKQIEELELIKDEISKKLQIKLN